VTAHRTECGVRFSPAELDAVERRFWGAIWGAVPGEAAAAHGIETGEFGPVQATIVTALPEARMLNLLLGATVPGAAADGHLAKALDWVEARDVSFYVPVTESEPEAGSAEELLRSRGYEHGYAWMKFVRDAHPPRFSQPAGVEVVEAVAGEETPFGMIAATGFGMPAWASAFFADLPGRPDWHCYVAEVDGEPAACAAMFVHQRIAEFGIAATLEPARGRGCQLALLHRRILDAAAAGCHTLFVETGERIPDRPSASYRNILRAGFEEAYLRPNWRRPEAPTGIEPV
jgi:GNAT superfamily N-acetyltransferase